jgi:hypothetical protein
MRSYITPLEREQQKKRAVRQGLAMAFEDGSKIWMQYEGKSIVGQDGITRFEGEYISTHGAGKYEGIKGTGSLKGQRVNLMEGGGESYYDSKLSFVLPAQ